MSSLRSSLRDTARRAGLHLHTDRSLPTGVDWLHDIVRSGRLGAAPLVFDVGANVGQTVHAVLDRLPAARIHAFEPFDSPRRALQALAADRPGVQVVPLALGAAPGVLQVRPRAQSVLNSLLDARNANGADKADRADGADGAGDPGESIRIETLAGYCAERSITSIDVLKTDTEGYDLHVLRGAEPLLRAGRIAFVYAEVSFEPGNTQNTPGLPLMEWMLGCGYRFLGLYETWPLHHFEPPNLFCNALFASRGGAGTGEGRA